MALIISQQILTTLISLKSFTVKTKLNQNNMYKAHPF